MNEIKFKSKDAKLQKKEHYPQSNFIDCPIKNEKDQKIDEHPVKGLAIYEKNEQ